MLGEGGAFLLQLREIILKKDSEEPWNSVSQTVERGRSEVCETRLEPLMHVSTGVEVSPPSFVINGMKIDCTSDDMPQSFSRASSLAFIKPGPSLVYRRDNKKHQRTFKGIFDK